MALIKSIDEVQKYLSVDISMSEKTVIPYVQPAEVEVIRLLGKELYAELDEWYNLGEEEGEEGEGTDGDALAALLPYVQRPVVNFAYHKGLSMLNVSIGNNGIAVVSNASLTPASKQRTDDLKADLERNAWDAMESLLEFLEENIADYESWESSEAYAYQYEYLISSARRFDELLRIDRSRLTYLAWRPTMADVELLEIYPVVSKEYCDELKEEIKAGSVSEENQVILPYLQKALAYLTAAIERDAKFANRGKAYLMEAKRLMDADIENYETYAASDAYDVDDTTYIKYENTEDSGFFVSS